MVGGGQESIGGNHPILLISQKEDPARIVDLELSGVAQQVLRPRAIENAERFTKFDAAH